MTAHKKQIDRVAREAVCRYWQVRDRQNKAQGGQTGRRDYGQRAATTGGKQMDGFAEGIVKLLVKAGVPQEAIFCRCKLELPGYFRAEKRWDMVVVHEGKLVCAVEFKSQAGPSFGNSFNNRTEEAIGNAVDFWAAYENKLLPLRPKPWLGFLVLLERHDKSLCTVGVKEPHFPVDAVFKDASYAQRYEILLSRLLREKKYEAACLLLSNQRDGARGKYTEPCEDLAFRAFVGSLLGHVQGHLMSI